MSATTTARIGKRGTLVIPADMRKRLGLEEDSIVAVEEREGGILIRPAAVIPIEIYSDERIAEFLLSNAVDSEEYESARDEVRSMSLDPDEIPHVRPGTSS